jgi:hypothetical protein
MSWRYGDTMNRNAGEVSTRRIAPGALCGYMERCLARYSCGDGSDCYGSTVGNAWKVVETSRLETRATEFVLYASVLHANEECEAKAIFTKYLSQSLRGGRGVRAYRMRPERW